MGRRPAIGEGLGSQGLGGWQRGRWEMKEWGDWGLTPDVSRAPCQSSTGREGPKWGTHPPCRSNHGTARRSDFSADSPATHEHITVAGPQCPHPQAWAPWEGAQQMFIRETYPSS